MSEVNSMVRLKSSDEEIIEVEIEVASMSETLKNMIADLGDLGDSVVPLTEVPSKTLGKVIEYCRYHVEAEKSFEGKPSIPEEEMKRWDAEFVKVEKAMIKDLILASNFLNIPELLDLVCQVVANMISGETVEEIRKTFGIKNDLTPAEEEEIRSQDEWALNPLN